MLAGEQILDVHGQVPVIARALACEVIEYSAPAGALVEDAGRTDQAAGVGQPVLDCDIELGAQAAVPCTVGMPAQEQVGDRGAGDVFATDVEQTGRGFDGHQMGPIRVMFVANQEIGGTDPFALGDLGVAAGPSAQFGFQPELALDPVLVFAQRGFAECEPAIADLKFAHEIEGVA